MLLWVAVCATENKMQHIQLIFQMDDETAAELKVVVQDQQKKVQLREQDVREEEPAGSSDEDAAPLSEAASSVTMSAAQQALEQEVTDLRMQVQAARDRCIFATILNTEAPFWLTRLCVYFSFHVSTGKRTSRRSCAKPRNRRSTKKCARSSGTSRMGSTIHRWTSSGSWGPPSPRNWRPRFVRCKHEEVGRAPLCPRTPLNVVSLV